MAAVKPTAQVLLVLNSGSSSLKYGLYEVTPQKTDTLLAGQAQTADEVGDALDTSTGRGRHKAPEAVGHRIVHGGTQLRAHTRIDAQTLRQMEAASSFAPLHAPAALAVLRWAQQRYPLRPHFACFDTVFHQTMPDVAKVLPLPRALAAEGVQRCGFHGLSCESILHQLAPQVPPRVVIAHLGHGASVTAVKDGKSIDTSMGLTPSGGVVMGTRCGDIDPGVLLYLLRQQRLGAGELQTLLDTQSGLLGISGVSGDMRALHEAAAGAGEHKADAQLAIDIFCQSVAKQIAGMVAVLGGLDLLVFTGGIGENDAVVRAAICHGLRWFHIRVDAARNSRPGSVAIHEVASRCAVQVRPSQEDEQIARHVRTLLTV